MSKLYTDWAVIYDDIYEQLFDYNADFEFYHHHLQQNSAVKILEVGCGTGRLAQRFCAHHYTYTGVDMSAEMLNIARKRLPHVLFIESDMRQLEIDDTFDAVLMTGRTISYLISNKDVLDTLKGISKILKPNGLFMFDAIDAVRLFFDFKKIEEENVEIKTAHNEFIRKATNKMNLQSGFTWDWATTYFQKKGVDFKKIGDDTSTLRAFTKDELAIFLSFFNLKIHFFVDKESYTWQSFYCIANQLVTT